MTTDAMLTKLDDTDMLAAEGAAVVTGCGMPSAPTHTAVLEA